MAKGTNRQQPPPITLAESLLGWTTPLWVEYSDAPEATASGFFYYRCGDGEVPTADGKLVWKPVQDNVLVTNRHVLLDDDGRLARSVSFTYRVLRDGRPAMEEFSLGEEDLADCALFHADANVDVAAIRVHKIYLEAAKRGVQFLRALPLTRADFPDRKQIPIDVADDLIVVGYPEGFFDAHNVFPIVKRGMVASAWGLPFEGRRCFAIDARLFPGSSGSLVMSKPTAVIHHPQHGLMTSQSGKQSALLGIYSSAATSVGEVIEVPGLQIRRTVEFDVGYVWYAEVIEELLAKPHSWLGQTIQEAE